MKLLVLLLLSAPSFASKTEHIPASFSYSNGRAVFVDFQKAEYEIIYDIDAKKASVTATISFVSAEKGFPIFDSVENPTLVELDQQVVSQQLVNTPSNETKVRVVSKEINPGQHLLRVSAPITRLLAFESAGVKSAFWTTDLADRAYLERYLPANLIYDQVKMIFNVHMVGGNSEHNVYSNGTVQRKTDRDISIEYPEYYNSTSVFFHLVPTSTVNEKKYNFSSSNGKNIPIVIYSAKNDPIDLDVALNKTMASLNHLERDFAPFPHPSLILYVAGDGGMEYCGAAMTSLRALNHELFHSYAARGIMPADGNSGWIDEALATWWDEGAHSQDTLFGSSKLSAHPLYTRKTDQESYSFGAEFMSFMNGKFSSKGGLNPFLRSYFSTQFFKTYLTDDFQKAMSKFYGVSLVDDFNRYIYGRTSAVPVNKKSMKNQSFHRHYTDAELQKLL